MFAESYRVCSFVYHLISNAKVQMRHLYTFCWVSQLSVSYGDCKRV